jgi:hypothetical protein
MLAAISALEVGMMAIALHAELMEFFSLTS